MMKATEYDHKYTGRVFFKKTSRGGLDDISLSDLKVGDVAKVIDFERGRIMYSSKFFKITKEVYISSEGKEMIGCEFL